MTEKTVEQYHFQSRDVIGYGAFGTVYKAFDNKS